MRVVRDLVVGQAPAPFDIVYNGDLAADSTTARYAGSLCKLMDYDDVDHGVFWTFAGLTTAMENVGGILEEAQATSDNYLLDDASYGFRRRKMTPIMPSTVIEAEYGQKDAAGTATYDDSATGTAASTTFTVTITTADYMIGGWVYFLSGDNAGYLHYITNNDTTTATFATALNYNVVATDTFLVINPPASRLVDFDATYTGLKSEIDDGSRADTVIGIDHWIQAPGIGKTKLDRDKHDGLKIDNARFFHHFTLPTTVWSNGWTTS